jgi:predicted nucleic acid-binding protein
VKIVLNTSPIIFLGKIDGLTVLTECFSEIYVPQGVVDELRDYQLPVNIHMRALSLEGAAYVRGALGRLHQGELEAIILAKELIVDYVILDDLLARRKAQRLGIQVMGTLGILLLLKKRRLLSAETTWLKIEQLTEQHGLYVSPHLLQQIKCQLLSSNY